MSGNNKTVLQNQDTKPEQKISDCVNEDDGFFSDVPLTGSSKSLIALNKFLKTNLLYESDSDDKCDSAYFSKESTPKDSISKYDKNSESTKTSEKKIICGIQTVEHIPKESEIYFDRAHTIYESICSEANFSSISQHHNDKIYVNEENTNSVTKTNNEKTKDKRKNDNFDLNKQEDEHIVLENISQTLSIGNDKNLELNGTHHSLDELNVYDNEKEEYLNHRKPPKIMPRHLPEVKLRTKFNNISAENRHTISDFTTWANRTNIYPDVYAPLPYSKYFPLFYLHYVSNVTS